MWHCTVATFRRCGASTGPAALPTRLSASTVLMQSWQNAHGAPVPAAHFRHVPAARSMWEDAWTGLWEQSAPPSAKPSHRYILSMFPYPSGKLHMGHVRVYSLSDCLARFARMQGHQVLHPMGWDGFGLPAENAALTRNVEPHDWTYDNIAEMKAQLLSLGVNVDWDREFATCDAAYYKWTQRLFLELLKHGLAYQKDGVVNWDPVDNTVLANEQIDRHGRSWRSGALVETRKLKQWFFRITHYAEELDSKLDSLRWPANVRQMQRNWIGASDGTTVTVQIDSGADACDAVDVFTTRVDTIFGMTFLCVSPDHELARSVKDPSTRSQLQALRAQVLSRQFGERAGVEIPNCRAIHPLTNERLPVYAGNYVLAEHGTGAVMGVPAHDERDFEFARRYGLPVKSVVAPTHGGDVDMPFVERGVLRDSGAFSGLSSDKACTALSAHLQDAGRGGAVRHYKLRDWLVSRQRYWGTPIPIIHCKSCGAVPVPEDQLPVLLPAPLLSSLDSDSLARGTEQAMSTSALGSNADIAMRWRNVPCPKCDAPAERETDTLDTFVDSSWYFLRFINPNFADGIFDTQAAKDFMPVDAYIGGIEHAVLHLLYARFITKFLHDKGGLNTDEPFQNLIVQGMVQGKTYKVLDTGNFVMADDIEPTADGGYTQVSTGHKCELVWEKMSKSKHNGVDPADVIREYGADVARLFVLFKAPVEKELQWDVEAIQGPHRWLLRVAQLVDRRTARQRNAGNSSAGQLGAAVSEYLIQLKTSVEEITAALERPSPNVAIALLMDLSNTISDFERDANGETQQLKLVDESLKVFMRLLAPFAPFHAAHFWLRLHSHEPVYEISAPLHRDLDVHAQPWPTAMDVEKLSSTVGLSSLGRDDCPLIVQINGKVKGNAKGLTVQIPADSDLDEDQLKARVIDQVRQTEVFEQSVRADDVKKFIVVLPYGRSGRRRCLVNVLTK